VAVMRINRKNVNVMWTMLVIAVAMSIRNRRVSVMATNIANVGATGIRRRSATAIKTIIAIAAAMTIKLKNVIATTWRLKEEHGDSRVFLFAQYGQTARLWR